MIINDLDKSYIQRFAEEPGMMEAVRKLFKVERDEWLPVINDSDSNNLIGQKMRAYTTALKIISQTFDDLEHYRGSKNNNNNVIHR